MPMIKLLLFLLPLSLFAQSFLISNIPIPKTYIQDLDPYECNEACMQEFLDEGMIFSFLSHADKKLENKEQNEVRVISISVLNLGSNILSDNVRIAILLPYKKIGKYASSTTNALFAYLITKNRSFELKSYKIESESKEDIHLALAKIAKDGFEYVIAPLTLEGAQNIIASNNELNIYFPTINKNDVNTTSPYLIFGGIDYQAQSDLLLKEAVSPLVIFSDKSNTGHKLAIYEEKKFTTIDDLNTSHYTQAEKKVIKYYVSRRTTNLENYLDENTKIIDGSFFINTPIVKSGMIMSQLTLYDVNATNVLSTQINYDPLILSMTQYNDRKDMIVANSITEHNNVLIEANSLLGNDIVYDWINYTTTVGIDYFFSILTNDDRRYDIPLKEKQMLYKVELIQPSLSRFIKYVSSQDSSKDFQ